MKKAAALLLFAFILTLSTVTYADYPNYLQNDRRFPLIWGHMGVGWFLDKTSISFNRIDSMHCTIAVNTIRVLDADRGNSNMSGVDTFYIYYDESNTAMYECNSSMSDA